MHADPRVCHRPIDLVVGTLFRAQHLTAGLERIEVNRCCRRNDTSDLADSLCYSCNFHYSCLTFEPAHLDADGTHAAFRVRRSEHW